MRGGELLLERAGELADKTGRDCGPALVLKGDDADRDDLRLRRARRARVSPEAQTDEDQGDAQNDQRAASTALGRPHISPSWGGTRRPSLS